MGRFSSDKTIRQVAGAGLTLLAMALTGLTSGQAQTNSLPQGAAPLTEQEILNKARENGNVLITPVMVKALLEKGNFTIESERPLTGEQNGHVIVAFSQGAPFVFLLQFCAVDGCLFMEALHMVQSASRGMPFSTSMANSLNTGLPYGTFTSEDEGNLMVRADSIARPLCASECLEADIGAYLGAVSATYKLVSAFLKTRTAEAGSAVQPDLLQTEQAFAAAIASLPRRSSMLLADISHGGLSGETTLSLGKEDKTLEVLEAELLSALSQNPDYAKFFDGDEIPSEAPEEFPNLFSGAE